MERKLRDEWREADRLFQRLVELDEPARRQALAATDASTTVRAKLESLLRASQRGNRLLDRAHIELPWLAVAPHGSPDEDPMLGRRIGDWKLIEWIGHGGMAVVYRGERVGHDYAQQAAVKLLGIALRGPAEQARFRREQRILAQLQHPHIASLIDAGVADDGTPYLAMSLIVGTRIDRYCEDHSLDFGARIELMLQVCAAVAYAHQQLVIHRDIKPGNILVDANGHATLLDFGIARLLDADDTGEATVTRAYTPEYAAPEQRGGDRALGTPVDVYGLGAVLHRLLVGASPQRDAHGNLVPPSVVARAHGNLQNAAALRSDLDAILTHALAADPGQRYAGANALAADLKAWRLHRPLQARRSNGWMRARRFVRRNRMVCLLALVAVLAASAGLSLFVVSSYAARQLAAELEAVTRFQTDMLQRIDPQQVGAQLRVALSGSQRNPARSDQTANAATGRIDYTGMAVGMLDEALLKPSLLAARKRFANQPRVQAMLLQTLASSYRDLGLIDAAEPIQTQATELFARTLGAGDPLTPASKREQLKLLRVRADGEPQPDGEARHREVLREHVRYLGEHSVDTALAREALGQWLMAHGKPVEAEKLIRAASSSIERARGHDDPDAIAARADLAYAVDAQGRYTEAIPYYQESIAEMAKVYGPEHRDTVLQEGNLAYVLDRVGRTTEAEALLRTVYEANRHRLGAEHPLTLNSLNSLAVVMGRNGDFAGAEPLQQRAFEDARNALGANHTFTLNAQMDLAHVYFKLGRYEDSSALLVEVIRRWTQNGNRAVLAKCQRMLGASLQASGKRQRAGQALMESWRIARELGQENEQRKTAEALIAFHAGAEGNPEQRKRWEDVLGRLGPGTTPSSK